MSNAHILAVAGTILCLGLTEPVLAAPDAAHGLVPNLVTIQDSHYAGRACADIELTDAEQARRQQPGAVGGQGYALLAGPAFRDGVIEADIAAELNSKADADVRAFAGLAFHISADNTSYEAVYLRMTNGTLNNPPPPPPRNVRAVQYIAHPDFHFAVSRAQFPGKYEKAAPVSLGTWHRLKLEIHGVHLKAFVDGTLVHEVDDLKYGGQSGGVGLWVDVGTKAHFANVTVKPQI